MRLKYKSLFNFLFVVYSIILNQKKKKKLWKAKNIYMKKKKIQLL